jgi:hypothetical protein
MKKIMVIVLLLVASFACADSWFSVDFAFQLGWIPQGNLNFYQPNKEIENLSNSFDAIFKIDAIMFNFIKMGGECCTNFGFISDCKTVDPIAFNPTGMTYKIYAGFEFVKGLSAIYEHSCSHPVCAYFAPQNGSGNVLLDQSFDRVYIEIKSKIDF